LKFRPILAGLSGGSGAKNAIFAVSGAHTARAAASIGGCALVLRTIAE
jgi:hypothetical protein